MEQKPRFPVRLPKLPDSLHLPKLPESLRSLKLPGLKISFNSPVVLSFTLACVIAHLINIISGGSANRLLFSVYRSSPLDLLTYLRCFTHVIGHSSWDHLLNNMMYILILGPILEEKYGPVNMIIVIVSTALVTSLFNILFFPRVALLGASGVVFAFMLLSSITRVEDHAIPLTFILVAILYIGSEVYDAIFVQDNISHMGHILGGMTGTVLGFLLARRKPHEQQNGLQ